MIKDLSRKVSKHAKASLSMSYEVCANAKLGELPTMTVFEQSKHHFKIALCH
jgi:hypothetical protein